MVALPLTLHSVPHSRAPARGETQETFGYRLQLADGPLVLADDPLLEAFGATIVSLADSDEHRDALQADCFDPGRVIRFLHEGIDDDGDAVVGAWDADGLRRAGTLPYLNAAVVAIGMEYGLDIGGLVLSEERTRRDDRRAELEILVFNAGLVQLEVPEGRFSRPTRPTRRRVVLFADGSSELRWWDPSGAGGPIEFDELPVSGELRGELRRLQEAFADAADSETMGALEDFERTWNRSALDDRARDLWRRARGELGASYAIGLLGRGMSRPVWSLDEVDDEDVEF